MMTLATCQSCVIVRTRVSRWRWRGKKGSSLQAFGDAQNGFVFGVLGDVEERGDFEEGLAKIVLSASRVLPLGMKIHVIHQWVYATQYKVANMMALPKNLNRALQVGTYGGSQYFHAVC